MKADDKNWFIEVWTDWNEPKSVAAQDSTY